MIFLSFLFVFVVYAKIKKSTVFFLSLLFYFVSLSHAEVTKRISSQKKREIVTFNVLCTVA